MSLTTRDGLPLGSSGQGRSGRPRHGWWRGESPPDVSRMRRLDAIVAMAAERQGGMGALEDALAASRSRTAEEIAATPDHRILATMTRRIFQAGFAWKVVDAKWDAFEAAFDNFDPGRCASMSEERFDDLLKDSSIVAMQPDMLCDTQWPILARSGEGSRQRSAVLRRLA